MSYYTDITSPYIWTLPWRDQSLSYHTGRVLRNVFRGRNLLQHQQQYYLYNHLISTSAIPLSFQVWYNLPVLSRQEQDAAGLCQFPTLRICLQEGIWWRSCGRAPTVAVLRIEERKTRFWFALCVQNGLWRVQFHTKNCSHHLAFLTSYCY